MDGTINNVRQHFGGKKYVAVVSTNRVIFSQAVRTVYIFKRVIFSFFFFFGIHRGQKVQTDRCDLKCSVGNISRNIKFGWK